MSLIKIIVYVVIVIVISLCIFKVAEAKWYDWFLGGTRTIEVVLEPEPEPIKTYSLGEKIPEEVINSLIAQHATGTKAYGMKRTIWCESQYWNIQSNIIDRRGLREDSWGVAQINLYWNPSVTKEQALDPEFAIKWMSDRWGKTKWYGWNPQTDTCNTVYK